MRLGAGAKPAAGAGGATTPSTHTLPSGLYAAAGMGGEIMPWPTLGANVGAFALAGCDTTPITKPTAVTRLPATIGVALTPSTTVGCVTGAWAPKAGGTNTTSVLIAIAKLAAFSAGANTPGPMFGASVGAFADSGGAFMPRSVAGAGAVPRSGPGFGTSDHMTVGLAESAAATSGGRFKLVPPTGDGDAPLALAGKMTCTATIPVGPDLAAACSAGANSVTVNPGAGMFACPRKRRSELKLLMFWFEKIVGTVTFVCAFIAAR